MPMPMSMPMPMPAPQAPQVLPAQPAQPAPVSAPVPAPVSNILVEIPQEEFNKLQDENDKKQFLGNYLYQFVVRQTDGAEDLAGKVTGMILDGQTIEYILYLCGDKKSFY